MNREYIKDFLNKEKAINKFGHNDIGSAKLLTVILKYTCRYNATAREWYYYDGRRWVIDPEGLRIRRITKDIAKELIIYSTTTEDEKYMKYCISWNDSTKRNKIIQDARDLNFFDNTQLDTNDYLLNCNNKIIILHKDKVEVREHSADLLLSQLANVNYIPTARCERWEKFVDEVMEHDKDKIRYLQKLFGLCLTGDTRFEKMWFLYGSTTRNGKSTMIETIAKMLGSYSTTIRPETLAIKNNVDSRTASPDIAKLAGKRLVICSEPPKRMPLDTALLKVMIGRDTVTARFLHQSEFEYTPRFKLVCNTNFLPLVTDPTVFGSDRVQVIPFDRHFEQDEQDRQLKNRLASNESLSGILNWCIQGWLLLNEEGLDEPQAVKASTRGYAESSDKIQSFINDCLIEKRECNLSIKDVYAKYEEWCKDCGFCCENKSNFISDIKTKGIFKSSGTINGKTCKNIIHGYDFLIDFEDSYTDNETPFD